MIDRCLEGLIRQAEIQEVKEGIESILIAIKTQNLWLFDRQSRGLPVQRYKQGVLAINDCEHNKQGNEMRKLSNKEGGQHTNEP